jgi:predicted lactoylglutathione lyase
MAKEMFVNLPVKDLERSKAFFRALGYGFNPRFTDENAACLVIGENIYAMLLVEKFFKTFTKKEIADTTRSTEVITALAYESKAKVDEIAGLAFANGGSPSNEPYDLGWMYGKSFQDPDGHLWEAFWMDPAGPPPA